MAIVLPLTAAAVFGGYVLVERRRRRTVTA
jgi:hypothetical protein